MTIAVDFDGVIHSYENGWQDGTIYGELMPGVVPALTWIMTEQPVFIHTSRRPWQVAVWIERKTGIPCTCGLSPHAQFWNHMGTLLVTDRKLPALAYIDDKGIRFENWTQALRDLERFTRKT